VSTVYFVKGKIVLPEGEIESSVLENLFLEHYEMQQDHKSSTLMRNWRWWELTNKKFNIYGSVHRNNILLYKSQQDAQVTEFILPDNCSTCFGRYYHPSSEQTTVNTANR